MKDDGARWQLFLLGSLYISQGTGHGFFNQSLPTLLRQQGVSLETIGFAYIVLIPWALNFLWAPLVDRWYWPRLGRRRSWILPSQVIFAALLVIVGAQLTSLPLALLLGLAALASFIAATSDIAIDGYAVDNIRPAQRGYVNGLQIGGYWIGMMIGSGLLLVIASRANLTVGTTVIAGMFLLVAFAVAVTGETRSPASQSPERPKLATFFTRPEARLMLLVIFCMRLGDGLGKSMLQPFLVDQGFTLEQIGMLQGAVGVSAALLGSLAGGLLVQPMGRGLALLSSGSLQVVSLVGCWLLTTVAQPDLVMVGIVIALSTFSTSFVLVALYTAMMDCCDRYQSGTDFSIQACASNLAVILGGLVGGQIAASFGYAGHFAVGAILAIAGLLVVGATYPRVASAIRVRSAAAEASA